MIQQLSPSSIEDEFLYPESDGKPLADNTIQFRLITTRTLQVNGDRTVPYKSEQK